MMYSMRKYEIYDKAGRKVRMLLKDREACFAFTCVKILHGVHCCF